MYNEEQVTFQMSILNSMVKKVIPVVTNRQKRPKYLLHPQ
jgi:hypothetical protein